MVDLNKTQLRLIAIDALRDLCGFIPRRFTDVVLLESSGDGQYIRFKIHGAEYVMEGRTITAIYTDKYMYELHHYETEER